MERTFKTFLVTGGAGFIGSNFIRYMLSAYPECKVINFDALTYAGNLENLKEVEADPNYRFVKGDICDRVLVDSLLSGGHEVFKSLHPQSSALSPVIDCIVHFAAESHVDRSITGPEAFLKTNVMGTFNLLESAKKHWLSESSSLSPQSSLFLHVSTDEVYGSLGDEGHFTEDTPFAPNSPYSASKAGSDHLARAYHHTYGLPVVTTNCSNNYGPYQFPEKLVPLVILNALEGKPLPVYGDGLNVRDWLYVDDHCSAIDMAIRQGRLGETYNVGGWNEWKNIDIVRLICQILDETIPDSPNRPHESLITFVKDRPGHDQRYAIDASKIKEELGWTPAHTFETGIRETIKWYLENSDWCETVRSGEYRDYYKHQYGS
ncbi:MAG: dTDP-glucose 4,6-dehydratase [Proteobacteria bacterium]|nr:dTDP-glucose 4,6-dehydratase [Pseudomonadota bacterium]